MPGEPSETLSDRGGVHGGVSECNSFGASMTRQDSAPDRGFDFLSLAQLVMRLDPDRTASGQPSNIPQYTTSQPGKVDRGVNGVTQDSPNGAQHTQPSAAADPSSPT